MSANPISKFWRLQSQLVGISDYDVFSTGALKGIMRWRNELQLKAGG
jgi:hypothetical protein